MNTLLPPEAGPVAVRERQAPLRAAYRSAPAGALVVDRAESLPHDLADPLHGRVSCGSRNPAAIDYAVHHAIGGLHEAPTPGDVLCAALASCQESSLRMVANVYGVALAELHVRVEARVDVRGTLGMDPRVPVAFENMRVCVHARPVPGTDPGRWQQVLRAAERACVVLQTLRGGVPVAFELAVSPGAGAA